MPSANLMIELEKCVAAQSWLNREYRRGAEHAPLWGPHVEDQCGGGVVAYLHQEFRTQLHREGFRPRALSLVVSLEGTMVLKAEL